MAELDRTNARRHELVDGGFDDSDDADSDSLRDQSVTDEDQTDAQVTLIESTPPPPEVLALGRRIVDVLADRQAADVVLLDISTMASFADYFVIGTGTSERHLVALRDAVDEALDEDGLQALQVEGESSSGWILMDYGDVVVHLFDARTRDYYKLERIWSRGATVVRVL